MAHILCLGSTARSLSRLIVPKKCRCVRSDTLGENVSRGRHGCQRGWLRGRNIKSTHVLYVLALHFSGHIEAKVAALPHVLIIEQLFFVAQRRKTSKTQRHHQLQLSPTSHCTDKTVKNRIEAHYTVGHIKPERTLISHLVAKHNVRAYLATSPPYNTPKAGLRNAPPAHKRNFIRARNLQRKPGGTPFGRPHHAQLFHTPRVGA